MKKLFIFLCMAAGITAFSATTAKKAPAGKDNFEINIIHINDHHSHLEAEKIDLDLEGKKTKVTIGGIGRVASKIKELRAKYDVPFIGIEPAIKPAALHSKTQTIGILATKGTLNSELFHKSVENHPDVKIIEQIGHGLVQLIENGDINSPEMEELLKSYLNPMVEKNIDYLVLGCSHYPYLIPQIQKIIPSHIKIIDSGEAVAKQTQKIIEQNHLLNSSKEKSSQIFYTNSEPEVLESILNHNEKVIYKNF